MGDFGTMGGSMFYVLGIFMFLAGCIIIVGYIGRGPRNDESTSHEKRL